MRFDFTFVAMPRDYIRLWLEFLPFQIVITLALFLALKMHNYIWHAVGLRDAMTMGMVVLLAFAVNVAASMISGYRLPLGVYCIMFLCEEVSIVGMRCFFRFCDVLRKIDTSGRVNGKACCFIDDNPHKKGKYLWYVKIVGGRDCILTAARDTTSPRSSL